MTLNQQAAETAEEFRVIKRKLNARIKQTGDTGIARRYWNRTIKEATATNNLALLKRLDTHFDLAPGSVLRAQNIIDTYLHDDSEETYSQIVTFTSQLKRTFIDDEEIYGFLPLLAKRPHDQERIADLITSNTTRPVTGLWTQSTPASIEPLLDATIDDAWLPPSHRHHLRYSATPISDRAYLAGIIDPDKNYSDELQDIEDSVLPYFAEGLRSGRITPAHLEGLLWDHTNGKRTMQYSLLLESVSDIDTKYDEYTTDTDRRGHSGIGAMELFNGLFFMHPVINDREIHTSTLPMSTDTEFAEESALLRFGMLLKNGIIRYYQGRRNNASGHHGQQLRDSRLKETIRTHNNPEAVARMAKEANDIHNEAIRDAVRRIDASYRSIMTSFEA